MLACDSTWRRPGKIEAGKSHENFIQVANGHLVNYSYFLRTDDALTGHAGTVSHTSCKRLALL